MKRILHDADNAERILKLTADTMILVSKEGLCVDVKTKSDLWFLQEDYLLGKDIFSLLPLHTRRKITPNFMHVLKEQKSISKNYKLELKGEVYYFKCIMYPYDDMVLCQYRDITARSNVKLQLERTNHELKEIQKAALIGQWKYNSEEGIFYYNGFTKIFCTDKPQSIPIDKYMDYIVEEDKEVFCQWLYKNEEEFNEDSIGYRIYYENTIFYLRIQTCLRELRPNGSVYLEGYIQNVTDIQRHRNDINILTHAINNAKECIFAAREDGSIIFANRQFKQNHQVPENQDLGKLKVYDLVGDLHSLEAWQRRYKQVKPGESADFIAYHPQKNNKEVLASQGTLYHVTSDEGESSYWSFTHDITERLRYESQIKRMNRIMDTIIEHLPAGIVVKDINNDFRYIYRNRESYNREIQVENAIGMNDFDFYPREIAEEKRMEDKEIVNTKKGKHFILEVRDKNSKQLILDKQKIMVESEDFSPIIISIEWDITQLELMKRELLASKEKAETSDNLKSAFLANMSHEIRTPLNAIVGFSRIIAESEDAEERKAYYEIVDANNERLLTLINEILDLSKIESGIVEFTYTPVRLEGLCKEIYEAHTFRTPPGVDLIFEPSDGSIIIESDKNRIFQVFSNLIGNAFKFTEKGSVSYGYHKNGNRILFHVTDTGTGIAPDKVGKVFERFMKLNNTAQGTGLGLSICKTILERLGGDITVSSILGKGTTFSFWLPDTSSHPETLIQKVTNDTSYQSNIESKKENINPSDVIPQPASANKKKQKSTILIAEDTDSNYDLLNAILGKTYDLVRARDGIEAVTLFNEVKPDLILMDIKMPNLDGLEATKIIRELSTDVPIIAQSAYAYEYDRNAAVNAGCTDFIPKPIAQDKLKVIIKKHLGI
ncbi:response regulator [Oscillospiraceae bacterium N12]|jgi:signal transduction histidine kinase/CheY-like chemotaxis protein|uniref:histidine kinase n=1 Tax=Jilunia laotingensis TaxID=2763675 RepID=A0A926FAA9_9BACT|nr:ATP-binding protein [Jilunia laotingensis]MBC8594685.1 response regulator [Jilunia laotingensis]